MEKKLTQGQLVSINVEGLNFTPEGFAMGSPCDNKGLEIFEHVNLDSYPSSYDFTGGSSIVRTGDLAYICRYVGRPSQISRDPHWFNYDVYEIFTNGNIRQIFRQNIKPINSTD